MGVKKTVDLNHILSKQLVLYKQASMDDSMSSTNYNIVTQSISSNCSEESGWTLYFEEFLANNDNYNTDNIIQDYEQEVEEEKEEEEDTSLSSSAYRAKRVRKVCNRKLISKTRNIHANKFVDEELEDTASSPGHSPKVNNELNHLCMKSNETDSQDVYKAYNSSHFQTEEKKDKLTNLSQEKGQNMQNAGEGIDMGILEAQLRKKGLYLVPMSMLLNHIS
ncbi:vascular-related unknown protein 2 [Spinacia oleracea]|uniref:Uncharacterized protein n=1 Tax=Spinacia oleracea TaxID=3562 RepID=A0A9R0IVR6_SPIOL|nr:vascular-related unknown protein 2-like [Spinacia oleracea]